VTCTQAHDRIADVLRGANLSIFAAVRSQIAQGSVLMKSIVKRQDVPNVSAEQQSLDGNLKLLRKLRWIGREEEAERMLVQLRNAGLRSPAAFSHGDRSHSLAIATYSNARKNARRENTSHGARAEV
jgi:hypothetical protein